MTCYQGRLPLKIYVECVSYALRSVTEQEYIDYAEFNLSKKNIYQHYEAVLIVYCNI